MESGRLNDIQLDARVRAYALEHHVSYLEALQTVVELERISASSRQEANAQEVSDAELDRRARSMAAQQGVSYAEALSAVAASFTNFREAALPVSITAAGISSAGQAMEGQLIEIFRAGSHVSDQGQTLFYTHGDVEAIARGYDPSLREAPLVIGHPESNGPSYGWVESLQATPDGRLLMTTREVHPEFAELVRTGRFKKRSASFYPPHNPNNPRPGTWYLRHVGFLGAQPPAIAGLKDIVFDR